MSFKYKCQVCDFSWICFWSKWLYSGADTVWCR